MTPGIVLGDNILANKENNFIASVYFGRQIDGRGFSGHLHGRVLCGRGSGQLCRQAISNLQPKEVVYQRGYEDRFSGSFGSKLYTYRLDEWVFSEEGQPQLCKQFGTKSLKGFGVEQFTSGISAAGAILYYLEFTEHREERATSPPSRVSTRTTTCGSTSSRSATSNSFRRTARARMQFRRRDRPYADADGRPSAETVDRHADQGPRESTKRLDVVERLIKDADLADVIREQVSLVGDLERIAGRIAAQHAPRTGAAQELARSHRTLKGCAGVHRRRPPACAGRADRPWRRSASVSPAKSTPTRRTTRYRRGGVIADGVDPETGRPAPHRAPRQDDYLARIQQRESEATGIPSLKISYNNVFGYYIEVRNAHKDKVPRRGYASRPSPTPSVTLRAN